MNDDAIEQEIQAKGLTAPRITPADLEANIAGETYFTAADGVLGAYHNHDGVYQGTDAHNESYALLTFCVLVLRNGFTVTGESACASPENFDAELGRKIARQNAEAKVWPLMGYELRSRLHEREQFLAGPQCSPAPEALADCPHAAPFRYCPQCVVSPCPVGLGQAGDGAVGD